MTQETMPKLYQFPYYNCRKGQRLTGRHTAWGNDCRSTGSIVTRRQMERRDNNGLTSVLFDFLSDNGAILEQCSY